jgi:hypothetical protein
MAEQLGEKDPENDTLNPFFLAAVGEGLELMLGSVSQPTENYSIDTPAADPADTGGDFGGGDGGGAGAGDSYAVPV